VETGKIKKWLKKTRTREQEREDVNGAEMA
jgi:hypothetical protein